MTAKVIPFVSPICTHMPDTSNWTAERWAEHEAAVTQWWDPPDPAALHDADWWEWYNNWYKWMPRYKKYHGIEGNGVDGA